MKENKTDRIINNTALILSRIIGFLPMLFLTLFAVLILWIKFMINFIRFGGETIAYTTKRNPLTLSDSIQRILDLDEENKMNYLNYLKDEKERSN